MHATTQVFTVLPRERLAVTRSLNYSTFAHRVTLVDIIDEHLKRSNFSKISELWDTLCRQGTQVCLVLQYCAG